MLYKSVLEFLHPFHDGACGLAAVGGFGGLCGGAGPAISSIRDYCAISSIRDYCAISSLIDYCAFSSI